MCGLSAAKNLSIMKITIDFDTHSKKIVICDAISFVNPSRANFFQIHMQVFCKIFVIYRASK